MICLEAIAQKQLLQRSKNAIAVKDDEETFSADNSKGPRLLPQNNQLVYGKFLQRNQEDI